MRPEPEPAVERSPDAEQRPGLEIVPDNPALEMASNNKGPDLQDEVPEWDRDPTFAQLKPDLDALEQAIAYTHGEPVEPKPRMPPEPESLTASIDEKEELPEITLDKSIETGIQNQLRQESADHQAPKTAKKSDVELGQIAANIANAKTLDDIDDIMAETLFGTSISMIAERRLRQRRTATRRGGADGQGSAPGSGKSTGSTVARRDLHRDTHARGERRIRPVRVAASEDGARTERRPAPVASATPPSRTSRELAAFER